MILSNNQMLALHSNNDFEPIGKNLVRYGKIIADESSEYNGNHERLTTFKLNGVTWLILKRNGFVMAADCKTKQTCKSLEMDIKTALLSCSTVLERTMCETLGRAEIRNLYK